MDSRSRRPVRRALAMCCLLLAVAAIVPVDSTAAARATRRALQTSSKAARHGGLAELGRDHTIAEERLVADSTNARLRCEVRCGACRVRFHLVALGGDQAAGIPCRIRRPGPERRRIPDLRRGASRARPDRQRNSTPVADCRQQRRDIDDRGGVAGTFLLTSTCTTNITHTFAADLDITLTSGRRGDPLARIMAARMSMFSTARSGMTTEDGRSTPTRRGDRYRLRERRRRKRRWCPRTQWPRSKTGVCRHVDALDWRRCHRRRWDSQFLVARARLSSLASDGHALFVVDGAVGQHSVDNSTVMSRSSLRIRQRTSLT